MINHWEEMTKFQNKMNGRSLEGAPSGDRITLARQMCNALFMEVAELQDSFSWKPWRDSVAADKENIKREIVDCLFFLHHIGTCFSIGPAELEAKYNEVMTNNVTRYHDGDFSGEEAEEKVTVNERLGHINELLIQILDKDTK